MVEESFELGRTEFPKGSNLDYISHCTNHDLIWINLKACVDFANSYRHRIPKVGDRVWMIPEYGMHGVHLI